MKGNSTNRLARTLRDSLIFSLILAFIATSTARAEVEIIDFRAVYRDNVIVIEWETDFERDMNGFFVTRSNSQFSGYARISDLVPSEGDEGFGSTYQFTDEFVIPNTLYWYRLEAVDNDNRVTFSELVQVMTGSSVNTPIATTALVTEPGGTPTATTFFSTAQTTPTRTSTPIAPFPQGFVTATGLGPATLTQMVTATLEATVTLSPTVTLLPLPEITLQFPTPVSNLDISSEGSEMKQEDPSEQQRKNIVTIIERAMFIGFIALVWIVLAVWFYMSSRRVE